MADSKLSDLTAITEPSYLDKMYLVDTSAGTSNSITIEDVRGAVFVTDFDDVDSTGVSDSTAGFQAAENYVAAKGGGIIYIPEGTYIKGRTFPPSNTTYIFHPASVMVQKASASNIWRIGQNAVNVHFYCNGALWQGDTVSGTSHVFQFEDCSNCSINQPNIVGAAASKDCINVTGASVGACYNIRIIGPGIVDGGNTCRNGISIVSVTSLLVDGIECKQANTAPGAGIDVEANDYGRVEDITIRNCHTHDNGTSGIAIVFGDKIRIKDCLVEDNGSNGIGVSGGGAQFDDGVYRGQDRRGVSNFNTGTGDITASDVSATGSAGLEVGTVCRFSKTGSGDVPAELNTQVRWVVTHVNTTGNTFRLGKSLDFGEVTSFSDAGAGTLDLDPLVSDVDLFCFVEGQASNVEISGCIVRNNGTTSKQITVNAAVNVWVHDNVVEQPDGQIGITASYSRNVKLESNRVIAARGHVSGASGINAGTATNIKSINNEVYNCGGEAFSWENCSHMYASGDYAYNCGLNVTDVYQVNGCPYSKFDNITLKVEEHGTETYGFDADADSDSIIVTGCDVMGVAASNANSLRVSGSNCVTRDNILNDGTIV